MKKLLFLLTALSISTGLFAQDKEAARKNKKEEKRKHIDALIKQEEEGVIAYTKQSTYGVKLYTDGYGFFYEVGRAKTIKKSMLYQVEIGERKHNKEEKRSGVATLAAPFIYGKLNFFYPLKLGVQQQLLLGNKSNKNGLSITGNLGGGLIAGFLRPYQVQVDKGGTRTYVRYDSPDSALFINSYQDASTAGPNFGTGWKYLKITPGAYIKPAVRFDYGRMNELVSALEIGITAEFYAKKIPQMLYLKEKQFFFSAYVAILFGKRK